MQIRIGAQEGTSIHKFINSDSDRYALYRVKAPRGTVRVGSYSYCTSSMQIQLAVQVLSSSSYRPKKLSRGIIQSWKSAAVLWIQNRHSEQIQRRVWIATSASMYVAVHWCTLAVHWCTLNVQRLTACQINSNRDSIEIQNPVWISNLHAVFLTFRLDTWIHPSLPSEFWIILSRQFKLNLSRNETC